MGSKLQPKTWAIKFDPNSNNFGSKYLNKAWSSRIFHRKSICLPKINFRQNVKNSRLIKSQFIQNTYCFYFEYKTLQISLLILKKNLQWWQNSELAKKWYFSSLRVTLSSLSQKNDITSLVTSRYHITEYGTPDYFVHVVLFKLIQVY